MRTVCLATILLVATLVAPASARPVKAGAGGSLHCRIVGGEKLPSVSGGAAAICAAIEKAVAAAAPGVRYSVEVKVVRPWMLAATPVVNGRALPAQKFAVNDADLNAKSIQRFAQSVAVAVAKAAKA